MMIDEDVADINKLPSTFVDKLAPSTSDGKFHLLLQILVFVSKNFYLKICCFILICD